MTIPAWNLELELEWDRSNVTPGWKVKWSSPGGHPTSCTVLELAQVWTQGLPPSFDVSVTLHTLVIWWLTILIFQVSCINSNSNLTFSASASVSSTGKEVFLSKSVSPTFLVENLLPSTSYTVKVWTYNSNGKHLRSSLGVEVFRSLLRKCKGNTGQIYKRPGCDKTEGPQVWTYFTHLYLFKTH